MNQQPIGHVFLDQKDARTAESNAGSDQCRGSFVCANSDGSTESLPNHLTGTGARDTSIPYVLLYLDDPSYYSSVLVCEY